MSHSHLPIRHLLKKLETTGPRPRRDMRPDWVAALIAEIAELFEPFTEVGRVGFDCRVAEERWSIGMYLGNTELIGGKTDGDIQHVDFQFDLLRLHRLLGPVERFQWNAFPGNSNREASHECSFIAVEGYYRNNPIRVRIFCTPPEECAPGLKHRADGTWETV